MADGYEHTTLPDRWKRALLLADIALGTRAPDDESIAAIRAEFTDAEIAELTLTVAVAHGFSKAAIAWGPEPRLPTTEVPTPGS